MSMARIQVRPLSQDTLVPSSTRNLNENIRYSVLKEIVGFKKVLHLTQGLRHVARLTKKLPVFHKIYSSNSPVRMILKSTETHSPGCQVRF